MSLTKNKIIFDILTLAQGGLSSDDSPINPRQIGFWVDSCRIDLIRQAFNKGQSVNPDIIQKIPCLDIQIIDASLCPCEVTGCKILRSVKQLPVTIETNQQNLLLNVSSVMLPSTPFSIIPFARASWSNSSKFGKNTPKAFLHDRYLYILSDVFYDKVSVSGVFAYPEDLKDFQTCQGDQCYSDDSVYPMSGHMIETVKKMIFDTEIKMYLGTKPDSVNNAAGN